MADSLLDNDPQVDQTKNDREELLSKWKDKSKEEILAAKIESDLFIKTQNARFDNIRDDYLKLREEANATASLKELIARQEQLHQEMGTATGIGHDYDTNQQGQFSPPPPQTPAQPGLGLKRNPPANATPTGTLGTQ